MPEKQAAKGPGEVRGIPEPARTVQPKNGNASWTSELFKDGSRCHFHADERGSHSSLFQDDSISGFFKGSFLLLIGQRLFAAQDKPFALKRRQVFEQFIRKGNGSHACLCLWQLHDGLVSCRMNDCSLDFDFSGFKVEIFPLKPQNFFKAQSSISLRIPRKTSAHVRVGMIRLLGELPPELLRSVTPDRGKEFAKHEEISAALNNVPFFFPPPHAP